MNSCVHMEDEWNNYHVSNARPFEKSFLKRTATP
jgi:hypothetical protein